MLHADQIMLADIQRIVDGDETAKGGLLGRLSKARMGLAAKPATAGWADFAVLLRQCLEHWRLSVHGAQPTQAVVRVPSASPWPTADQWSKCSLRADVIEGARLRLTLMPWTPDWLSPKDIRVAEDAALAAKSGTAEDLEPILHDELVSEVTGYATANSVGQRDAIRSVYLTPPGSTTLALLPTGSGKSLVFQFAALHSAARDGMVVVIVPTVALARDQAERYRQFLGNTASQVPLAFHSGLPAHERAELRRGLASGTLPIVFLSPEAALGSLREPLMEAAALGRVSLFAVDEAHIVAQWGDSFRPHFQALGGLRKAMHLASPPSQRFRTVLLTATLTSEAYDVLCDVFGATEGDGPRLEVVSELRLRCEPGYLVSYCNEPERREASALKDRRICEALYHLPRPLLLYTTKVPDAKEWHRRLSQELGFARLRCVVGGDMSTDAGAQVLAEWKSGSIDVVVATSAFGLGVDQSDVRTVVHACVPETIDRWYQEVGRAGRDGRSCVSLLVATPADLALAEDMGEDTLISSEKAFSRWTAMRLGAVVTTAGRLIVSLDSLHKGLTVTSDLNRSWNFRVLTMMARAGMLRIAHDGRPRVHENDEPPPPSVAVDIKTAAHSELRSFELAFRPVREARRLADLEEGARMRRLVEGAAPVHELLASAYSVPRVGISVGRSAGDCPVTRASGDATHARGFVRSVHPGEHLDIAVAPVLAGLFDAIEDGHRPRLFVSYEKPRAGFEWREQLKRLLRLLTASGVIEFDLPTNTGLASQSPWTQLSQSALRRYVFRARPDTLAGSSWQVPMFTLVDHGAVFHLRSALQRRRPWHVVMVPDDTPDLVRADRKFFDTRRSMPLSVLQERLGAS